MGIYDRDYYRRDGPSYLGSFMEHGAICKWLIGINIVVFILQMVTRSLDVTDDGVYVDGGLTSWLDLNVAAVMQGQVWRLLTYAFLHSVGSPMHILFNMLFLWWFGSDVEDIYGPMEFLAIYLMSAFAGGVLFAATEIVTQSSGAALGASGAVTAVMVLCAFHFPSRVIYLMWIIPVPIWLFVIGSVAIDAWTWLGRVQNGIAVACHLGGAAFAFGYYKAHLRLTNLLPDLRNWRRRLKAPKLRVYREEPEQLHMPQKVGVGAVQNAPALLPDDEQLEAKMDAVLEKISRVGKENLTESEREVLLRASERLKKRRN